MLDFYFVTGAVLLCLLCAAACSWCLWKSVRALERIEALEDDVYIREYGHPIRRGKEGYQPGGSLQTAPPATGYGAPLNPPNQGSAVKRN